MPNSTMTIAVNGEVSLDSFVQAISHFRGMIIALKDEISPAARIKWLVDDLQSGSAVATVRGTSPTLHAVEPIAAAYLGVGRALADGRPVPYSPRVTKEALGLTKILGGSVTSIRFETEEDDATIDNPGVGERRSTLSIAYGAVEGRVQTLTSRDSLRFTLYDAVHDRAVACYVDADHLDLMRNAWDRRAIVEGRVTRESLTGRPVAIRGVRRITLFDDVVPGTAVRAARGIARLTSDQPSSTEVIRWLRDG